MVEFLFVRSTAYRAVWVPARRLELAARPGRGHGSSAGIMRLECIDESERLRTAAGAWT